MAYMDHDGAKIVASDGDVIEVSYKRGVVTQRARVTVDAEGPVLSNVGPGSGTKTSSGTIIFTVEVTDAGIGVGTLRGEDDAGDAGDADDVKAAVLFTFTDFDDSFRGNPVDLEDGNWRISKLIALDSDGNYPWKITATDQLGNEKTSDAVEDDEEVEGSAGLQNYALAIDTAKPEIASAKTGPTLDTSGDEAAADHDANNRKSILVVFNEDLNGDTVDEDDFLVVVDKQDLDIALVEWHEDEASYVFITLDTELSGDDTPTVQVVRGIEDVAGNEQTSFEPDDPAEDGIAPKLSVSIVGTADDNPVTNGTLRVRVSADEDSVDPNAKTGAVAQLIGDEGALEDTAGAEIRTITPNKTWEWTFEFDDEGRDDGLYNVCVTITDLEDNAGTAGECGDTVDTESDDIIVFEVDTGIGLGKKADDTANAIADVVTPAATDNMAAFIEIDLSGEGSEYTDDSHGTITVLSVTIDGEAVDAATQDDKQFTIAPPADGYSLGEHMVVVTATDETGNTVTFGAVTVEITVRGAFNIPLRPGYNLISLPGTPESTDINDVIGADHSINQVLTYSPFVEGGWLSAERGDDGAFTGTLTTIDGSTAYIVRTTSFEGLDVSIPRMALGNVLPPQTNLGVGWNLVAVVDLTSDLKSGDTIEDYFLGTGEAILTISGSGRLEAVVGEDATVGKGYWVYASRPAVLLPTQR